MLTGDKVETATCIATSAGFKSKNQKMYYIRDMKTVKEVDILLK
jgi:magnesium-transporting ATPase (P-type)